MKTKFGLREWIEILGVLAVVASLLFVGSELRLTRSIARSEGYTEMAELERSLREFIAEHSEIWYKGCLAEDLDEEESVIFNSIAQSRIALGFTRWGRTGAGISTNNPDRIARQLAWNRYRYPGFDRAWRENESAQGFGVRSNWAEAVDEQLELLAASNESREFDVGWCGR